MSGPFCFSGGPGLCKGPLGYAMIKKLKVYAEASHPHAAQQPKALNI